VATGRAMARSGGSRRRAAPERLARDYGGSVPASTKPLTLRQCALAVSVLADIDLSPDDSGVRIAGSPRDGGRADARGAVLVPWAELAEALGGHDPLSPSGRRRAATLFRLCRILAEHDSHPEDAVAPIRHAARVLALPPGHALHPGPDWVVQRPRGGALDLGIGLLGLGDHPDDAQPLPPSLARRLGLRPDQWWPDLSDHLERMGGLAATRIARDGRPVLRPVGGCDALTLLASAPLREQLAAGDGTGMRAVAVPTRRRGWFDLARIDPAYARAAWSITTETERGLPAPVLVTRHEVVMPCPGHDVVAACLRR
jgi:hypothetical protein